MTFVVVTFNVPLLYWVAILLYNNVELVIRLADPTTTATGGHSTAAAAVVAKLTDNAVTTSLPLFDKVGSLLLGILEPPRPE